MRLYVIGALVGIALLGAWGTYSQYRQRLIAEGRAQVAQEQLDERLRLLNASEVRREQIESDALIAIATADSLRREAEGRAAQVRIVYREATVRATAAGDSLAATLDSLAAVVPANLTDMVAEAERQHDRERLANREALQALLDELTETQLQLSMADEARRAIEERHAALEASFAAQGEALALAQEALEARTEQAQGPWYGGVSRVLLVGAAGVLGYVVAQ